MPLSANLARARSLYDAGKCPEALSSLDQNHPSGEDELRRQVESVLSAYKESKEAMEKRELENALSRWKSLEELEPSKQNFFNKEARRMAEQLENPKARALAYKGWGDESHKSKRFVEARSYYDKAVAADASVGAEELRQMDTRGMYLVNMAMNPGTKTPEERRQMFVEATSLLSPKHPGYEEAKKGLEKLDSGK